MPARRCCAANCEGTEHLYSWPSDPSLAAKWTKFVTVKLKNFTLSSNTRICFRHFAERMFANYVQYKTMKEHNIK